MINVKSFLITSCFLLGFTANPERAMAHSMETNYYLNANSLEIQAVFSNGEVLPHAPIRIYSPNDPTKPWLEGTTDHNGKFVFNPDQTLSGDWSVEIGEDSHWDQLTVPVEDHGIDLEAISVLEDPQTPHHSRFSSQFMILAIALISGIGSPWIKGKFY